MHLIQERYLTSMNILEINNLSIEFSRNKILTKVLNNVSFSIKKNETLALVGESGSGKSVTALSILQLLPKDSAKYVSGTIKINNQEYLSSRINKIENIRGRKISMIFQEPMTSLNPLHTIKKQLKEAITLYKKVSESEVQKNIEKLLDLVGLDEINQRLNSYPHELSGGQRQRVMIAMAIANNPSLLIADEPTTALDVTVQMQILKLLKSLQKKIDMSILLITHDLSIVKKISDKICIMKDGSIVENGNTEFVFSNPRHSYTKALINSELGNGFNKKNNSNKTILKIKNMTIKYPLKKGFFNKKLSFLTAVNNISFNLNEMETLGIVGESGSGKTTLGLAILKLVKSEGSIIFNTHDINNLKQKDLRSKRKDIQIVFQDPFGSLSPRLSIKQIVGEGLDVHYPNLSKEKKLNKIEKTLVEVGIDRRVMDRYPHEFSGGQRQRISIARSIIIRPKLIILDEPTSALDKTIQVQIINLLNELQIKYNLSYIFISHDLKVIRSVSDKIIVLKNGKLVEAGETKLIFNAPKNEYTKNLLKSVPY